MKSVSSRCLDLVTLLGAAYADVRVVHSERESVRVVNGRLNHAIESESTGFGVRVLVDGAWGFSSSSSFEPAEVDRVAAEAVAIARASSVARTNPVTLVETQRVVGVYETPVLRDPFDVPLEEKLDLLLRADARMRQVKGIRQAEGVLELERQEKWFSSTLGSEIAQTLTQTGAVIRSTAVGEHDVQRRSYPSGFSRHQLATGYEFIESLHLVDHAPRIAEEAVMLLDAPPCPAEVTTLILDGTQLCLQLHESCGHAIELDRVLGSEASFAGTSFLTLDRLGRFRYGSEIVNITADATIPGGAGTFAFDDEGVPAVRTPIVREGVFVGYLTSRETAGAFGQASNGAMRAEDWNRIPLIRMTNVNLEPGTWAFDDLVADTDEGIYMCTNRSLSIDDRRLNFHFGTEIAWEIRKGKLGRALKNPVYTGVTPRFWASCDAICDAAHWQMWTVPICEKGQPSQAIATGHGTAPARFRDVQVGSRG